MLTPRQQQPDAKQEHQQRPGRPRLIVGRLRGVTAAWLGRPLSSLHLLLGVFVLLTALGLAMVLSASSVDSLGKTGSSFKVFYRQTAFCVAGLMMFWVGLRVPPRRLRVIAPYLLLGSLVLLVGVLIPGVGTSIAGARKWYTLGGLSFQPSEAAKVSLALWGAHVLTARHRSIRGWRHSITPLMPVTLVMLTLVMLEPDLGTSISVGILVTALLYFADAPWPLMATVAGAGTLGALAVSLTASYRQSRITTFLSPGTDPQGAGYQSIQALYSLADGGLFGVGLGQSRAKWSYLPNAYNDFIFAIIGEELGLIGGLVVLVLFGILAWTGLRIAARNTDPWTKVLTAALTTWLVAQATINIGYVVGLLPVTGIPLPLISSGGTSLVVTMFAFGVLANAARHEPAAAATLRLHGPGRLARLIHLPPPEPVRSPSSNRQRAMR